MLSRVLQYTRDLTFEISPSILCEVGFDAAIEWLGERMAKQAQASEVTIEIGRDGDEMRMVLEDNGVGFDASKSMVGGVTGGDGLFDISERLAHLGGHLSFSIAPGLGSTFTFTAPLSDEPPGHDRRPPY
jgi:signal transduction histidine kinase